MRRSFLEWLFYFLFLCALGLVLLFFVSSPSSATYEILVEEDVEEPVEDEPVEVVIINGDTEKEAAPVETYEEWFRKNANKIDGCRITYYCAEQRNHICGTGDGITATGTPVIPYWTCAVDPSVIPYWSDVLVDYGDSWAFYSAQDCGGSIKGNKIDLAVTGHQEALENGVKEATVYWLPREYGREN